MKTRSTREIFLIEIEAFLIKEDMTASKLGSAVMGDHKFVLRLRKGNGCNIDSMDRVRAFMASYHRARPSLRRMLNRSAAA